MDKPPVSLNLAFLLITLVSLLLSVFFIYQTWRLNQKLNALIQSQSIPTPSVANPSLAETPPVDATSSWKTYMSNNGYSLKYPIDWIAKSSVPGPGEIVLVSSSRGFTTYPQEFIGVTSTIPRVSIDTLDPKQETILGVNDYRSWVEYSKKNQFFKVLKESNSKIDGIDAVVLEGTFESSGKITNHKAYLTHTSDNSKYVFMLFDDYSNGKYMSLFDQILSTFKFLEQTTLVPPDFQTQVSGARCAPVSTESIVTITIPMDKVPQPRCVHVTSNQKLKIINNSQGSININVGEIQTSLVPTQSFQFPKTMGEFLAPGGHSIAGAEIWLE